MEFTTVIDGKKFVALQNNVDECIEDINFTIKRSPKERSNNFQIICDSDEVIAYLLKKVVDDNPEYEVYDLSENKTTSLFDFNIKAEKTPLVVYGFEKYLKKLMIFFSEEQYAVFLVKNIWSHKEDFILQLN